MQFEIIYLTESEELLLLQSSSVWSKKERNANFILDSIEAHLSRQGLDGKGITNEVYQEQWAEKFNELSKAHKQICDCTTHPTEADKPPF